MLVSYQLYATFRTAQNAAATDVQNLALVIESQLNADFEAADRTVSDVAASMEPRAMRLSAVNEQGPHITRHLRSAVRAISSASAMRIFDANGDRLYTSVDTEPTTNIFGRVFFQQLRTDPAAATVFSAAAIGQITKRPTMYVVRAIREPNGTFLGIALIAIDLTAIREQFKHIELGKRGAVTLRRIDDGTLVVRHPELVDETNQPVQNTPIRNAILNGARSGTVEITSPYDGISRMYGYRKVGSFPFFIAVAMAQEDYLAEWHQNTAFLLTGALTFLAILIVVDARRNRSEIRLRESEQRFRKLIDHNNAIILQIDAVTGHILDANASACRFYGWSKAQLCRMAISDINALAPENVAAERALATTEQRNHFVFPHRLANGETRTVEVHSTAVVQGGRTLLVSIIHDITKRAEDEEKINALVREQQAILNSHIVGIVKIRKRKLVWANTAFADMVGYTTDELIGKSSRMLHLSDQAYLEFAEVAYPVLQSGGIFRHEIQFRRKDGTSGWYELSSSLLDTQRNESIWAIIDVTARKQLEATLKESERQLVEAQSLAKIGSWRVVFGEDDMQDLWTASKEAKRLYGLAADAEIKTTRRFDQIPPEDREMIHKVWLAAKSGHGAPEWRYRIVVAGEMRWLKVTSRFLFDEHRKPLEASGTIQDVTELKRMEDVREEALSRLQKIASRVPGVVYQYLMRPDGSSCFPFASDAIRDIYRVHPEEVRHDASAAFAAIHPDDRDGVVASIQVSAHDLTPWRHEYRVRFEDGVVRWLSGNAVPQAEPSGGVLWHGFISDITEHKQAEEAVRRASQYSRSLIEASLDPLVTISALGKITDVNTATERVTGVVRSTLVGSDFANYFTAPEKARQGYEQAFAQGFVTDYPLAIRHVSGKVTDVLYNASVYTDDKGNVLGVFAAARDVTEHKQAEEKLRLAASVFTHAREGIMITSPDGTIIDVNATFTRITGFTREEVTGRNPRLLSSGRQDKSFYATMWQNLTERGYWYGEVWNRRKNGEVYAEMQTISAVRDAEGTIRQYVALFSDITPLKEHQQQLEHIAHFDALTGLPNRPLLADRLHQAMAQAQRRGQRLAVAFLDLDGFKAINDNFGHEAGDQLLIAVANRMRLVLRDTDTLARLGGDEFVAVLLDLGDVSATGTMLARLLSAAAEPVGFGDNILQVSASLGVTFYPQAMDIDADQLLRQADQAMYQAKLAGKNRYQFFDEEHDSNLRTQNESFERIRRALAQNEFVLHYQPKVNMRTGKVIGAEALIRWHHPVKGLMPPGAFLPLIEDHPLAVDLGEWVIRSALAQIGLWRQAGLNIPVSVNVGARQLQQVSFVSRLRELLADFPQVEPSCLELEILETSALEDLARVSHVIEECRDIGVTFAMDDFGTGYSSLTYLKRLHVTLLKIDQSFVRSMLEDTEDLAILHGVIGLAAAFRREVLAEGVETVAHGSLLLQLGCELGQGYGIARPMAASGLPAWAATWQPDAAWSGQSVVAREDIPLVYAGVEHRTWIANMGAYVRGERNTPPPLDQHQCNFGRWLDGDGRLRYGAHRGFTAMATLHRQVHAAAADIVACQEANEHREAVAKLASLDSLRDQLLNELNTLSQAAKD